MKTMTLLSLGILGLTLFGSCKRSYTCKCKYEEAHEDHTHDEYTTYPLGELFRRQAIRKCDDKQEALSSNPEYSQVNCYL